MASENEDGNADDDRTAEEDDEDDDDEKEEDDEDLLSASSSTNAADSPLFLFTERSSMVQSPSRVPSTFLCAKETALKRLEA